MSKIILPPKLFILSLQKLELAGIISLFEMCGSNQISVIGITLGDLANFPFRSLHHLLSGEGRHLNSTSRTHRASLLSLCTKSC